MLSGPWAPPLHVGRRVLMCPVLQVSETENIRKNLAIERMIVEGCDILLDVNQMFVRQGKKPAAAAALSSCFPKEAVPSFPRRSIDFPRKTTDLFTSEDGEEAGATPRSQRSHSTVSYMSREQQIATFGNRRRLSSLRQSSIGGVMPAAAAAAAAAASSSGSAGASMVRHTLSLGASPLSPPQPDSGRRASDIPRIRKKSVRISDESFDECEELAASGSPSQLGPSVFTPSATPNSSPEDQEGGGGAGGAARAAGLTPVEERSSLDSGEDPRQAVAS